MTCPEFKERFASLHEATTAQVTEAADHYRACQECKAWVNKDTGTEKKATDSATQTQRT